MGVAIYLFILLATVVLIISMLFLMFRAVLYMFPMAFGAVFVPSDDEKLKIMMELAQIKPSDKVIDLGSGDGRVMLEVAKKGARVDGVEINPILVEKSRRELRKAGYNQISKVIMGNLWNQDLSNYDVVLVYGTTYIMEKLEEKLKSELRTGSRVVSNYFEFPTWKPKKTKGGVRLYIR